MFAKIDLFHNDFNLCCILFGAVDWEELLLPALSFLLCRGLHTCLSETRV